MDLVKHFSCMTEVAGGGVFRAKRNSMLYWKRPSLILEATKFSVHLQVIKLTFETTQCQRIVQNQNILKAHLKFPTKG